MPFLPLPFRLTGQRSRLTAAAASAAGMLAISGIVVVVLSGTSSAERTDRATPLTRNVTPEQISTVVRWNANDDDAQVWLTAKDPELAMATISVDAPDGRTIFHDQLDPTGGHGQQRLEYRSSEHSLSDLEEIYPPGEYQWSGRTAEGQPIRGTTEISYELPEAPTVTAPTDEATDVPIEDVVLEWNPVTDAEWIFVEVEAQGDGRELLIRLEGEATSLALPTGYLEARTEYEVELKAVDANGNQAAADSLFTTM
jgi:hypothetical protein